jgi:protein-disulfide isomerase
VQVTDRLYLDQSRWSQDGTVEASVARALSKEDLKRVEALLGDSDIDAAIERDLALGRRQGVRSTPTFFITAQGKTERITGIVQYSILRRYLDSRLGQ